MAKTSVEVVKPKPPLEIGSNVAPIIPRNVDELARLANMVIVAGLAPDSFKGRNDQETAAKICIAIMRGAECGMAPMNALANIAVINGKAALFGDGIVALVQRSGLLEKVESGYEGTKDEDDWTAFYRAWRKGQEVPYEGRFSVSDAKRARLWNNPKRQPWIAYPGVMLMARARAFALRSGFADCLAGLSIAEEIRDLPAPAAEVSTDFLEGKPQIEDASEETAPEGDIVAIARDVASMGQEALERHLDTLNEDDKAIVGAIMEDLVDIAADADKRSEGGT